MNCLNNIFNLISGIYTVKFDYVTISWGPVQTTVPPGDDGMNNIRIRAFEVIILCLDEPLSATQI